MNINKDRIDQYKYFNPLQANFPILYLLRMSENLLQSFVWPIVYSCAKVVIFILQLIFQKHWKLLLATDFKIFDKKLVNNN